MKRQKMVDKRPRRHDQELMPIWPRRIQFEGFRSER